MNINQKSMVDEINLKELFLSLWRQKIIIICMFLIITILTGLYSVFMITPVYQSKLNMVISMPATLTTRFGDYTLPITTNQQYIQLITNNDILSNTIKDMGYDAGVTLEGLKSRISLGTINTTNAVQNNFDVTVSADNPKEAKQLADALFANYSEYLYAMTTERAVLYYYDTFSVQIKTLENKVKSNTELMKKNEELLKSIPQTLDVKDALATIHSQSDTTDIVLGDIINPNYAKVEGDILLLKETINTDQNTISDNESYLKELDTEKNNIAKYYESGKKTALESSVNDIIHNNVYLSSSPIEPTHKTSPSNSRNVIIGAFLGGMIGVLAALIKEYWFTKQ